MTTIRARFQSPHDHQTIVVGAESLDPYLAQMLADDFRRNARGRAELRLDGRPAERSRAVAMLVDALRDAGVRIRIQEETGHAR